MSDNCVAQVENFDGGQKNTFVRQNFYQSLHFIGKFCYVFLLIIVIMFKFSLKQVSNLLFCVAQVENFNGGQKNTFVRQDSRSPPAFIFHMSVDTIIVLFLPLIILCAAPCCNYILTFCNCSEPRRAGGCFFRKNVLAARTVSPAMQTQYIIKCRTDEDTSTLL